MDVSFQQIMQHSSIHFLAAFPASSKNTENKHRKITKDMILFHLQLLKHH